MTDNTPAKRGYLAPGKVKMQFVFAGTMRDDLRAQAVRENDTMTGVLTRALDAYLQENKPAPEPEPKRRGRPRKAA